MKNIKLIYTEIGAVPVIINKVERNGSITYEGSVLGEHNIFIQAKTEYFCLDQLQKAFECSMHFWIRYELSEIGLNFEGKIKKEWYNE